MRKPPAVSNWQKLSPTHFLERAGTVYASRLAVVDAEVSRTWQEFRARARRFASALRKEGLKKGERVKLRHRIILHKGDEKAAHIAEAFEKYAKEVK